MPRWIGRLLWSLRGKRRVTIHLDRAIDNGGSMSLDGIMIGRWSGHYVLEMGKLLQPDGAGGASSLSLDARYVEIPAERVLFCEVHR